MYIVRTMRTGYSLRISIPRLVQRHMGLRKGDYVIIRTVEGAGISARKMTLEELERAGVPRDSSGAD